MGLTDLSQEEYSAMEAVLTTAIKYAELAEDATLFLERYEGEISQEDSDAMIEEYAQASYALVAAVRKYKVLNNKRRIRPAL